MFLPLTPENFLRKSHKSANSKKIFFHPAEKKIPIGRAEPPRTSRHLFLLEKKFHAQHLSCGYFVFWPEMYGTNLVLFLEKTIILKT